MALPVQPIMPVPGRFPNRTRSSAQAPALHLSEEKYAAFESRAVDLILNSGYHLNSGVALEEELRRRCDDLARPFVSGVELEGANADGTFPKAPFIVRELVPGVPFVRCPAGDERRRYTLQFTGREFRGNVAAYCNDTCPAAGCIYGCSKCHRN